MCEDVVKVHKVFLSFTTRHGFYYTLVTYSVKKKEKETYSHALKLQMSHYCIC